jgi:hypothetical protein
VVALDLYPIAAPGPVAAVRSFRDHTLQAWREAQPVLGQLGIGRMPNQLQTIMSAAQKLLEPRSATSERQVCQIRRLESQQIEDNECSRPLPREVVGHSAPTAEAVLKRTKIRVAVVIADNNLTIEDGAVRQVATRGHKLRERGSQIAEVAAKQLDRSVFRSRQEPTEAIELGLVPPCVATR